MSEQKKQTNEPTPKRVDPTEQRELDDAALESVAGGCQIDCSNMNTCFDFTSIQQAVPDVNW